MLDNLDKLDKVLDKPEDKNQPDLTSVRTLITSTTAIARHLSLSLNAIYRWLKVNRIPGAHIVKVANFYNVEVLDLLPLTGSDLSSGPGAGKKPKDTLPTLIEVQKGTLTIAEAATRLNISEISIKLSLTHWGQQLEHLYDTLLKLEAGKITLQVACRLLQVTESTLHGLRRKYGFAPGHPKSMKPLPTLPKRKADNREAALQVIAGRTTVKGMAAKMGVSERTIFRKIADLGSVSVQELASFPATFRLAYADEIEKNTKKYVENWLKYAKDQRLLVKKDTRYPQTPETWRNETVQRMLIGFLLSEASLDEIAASRGADPVILKGLFNSHLRLLGLSFAEVQLMGLNHQMALAELLIWASVRARKVPVAAEEGDHV